MSVSEATQMPSKTSGEWWKSAVVYQVYPRSFQDSNGDGIGDLRGIINRLDHLERLGIDVIWLSPVYRSPQADNGYDISDYHEIDPVFGTLEDFDELLVAVHARGMKLVMDLVVNHTSDEHAWFTQSRSHREDPKRDWYIWRPARPGTIPGEPGSEPNNWESFFSGPTWEFDQATGEYYLHLFGKKQPDLNWENPQVRHAVYDMMRWWLDRGVDGFRMDVINLISKHPDLPDGEVSSKSGYGDGFPYYAHGPRLHEFLQEMHREVFEGRDGLLTVGETPGATPADGVLFTDPARHELNMVFQFEHVSLEHVNGKFHSRDLQPGELADSFTRWQGALAEVGWNSLYLSNHDQPRAVSRFGEDRRWWRESATALATILHLQRGTPYVYQGEEIGMTNAPFENVADYRDIETLNHFATALAAGHDVASVINGVQAMSRDHARTPMQWDAGDNAGFTTGTPWISVNPNSGELNAQSQYDRPGSIFEHYRRLIALRHESRVVAEGDFSRIDAGSAAVFAFERGLGSEALLVIANLSSEPMTPVLPRRVREYWRDVPPLLTNVPTRVEAAAALAPWEARVYRK